MRNQVYWMALGLALTSIVVLIGSLPYQASADSAQQSAAARLLATPLPAQPSQTCRDNLIRLYTAATDACINAPDGTICNGGAAPVGSPPGPAANSLALQGTIVPVDTLESIIAPAFAADGSSGGLVWLRVDTIGMNMLLVGDTAVRNLVDETSQFDPWTAMLARTGTGERGCSAAPPNAFILQNADPFAPIRFVINGASVDLNGTVMIYTTMDQTVFVVIEGLARVLSAGMSETPVAGQEVRVNYDSADFTFPLGRPTLPVPYTPRTLDGVPIELFDRATILPQPGFVATDGAVNLRTSPSTQSPVIYQVPPEQRLTILGRNPDGDWYHVRLANGQTGWMFAELLRRNHGAIETVYQSTPQPPQRYGDSGREAIVASPSGLTMRTAPHVRFGAVYALTDGTPLELLARSPYSPWVKVQSENVIGWVPLINIDTAAIVDSLPIDFDVPLPPEPTAIPGLSGFAFPDPACFPDC